MENSLESIEKERMQFAVLIDADNISSRYAATIFEELETYGISTYRRIYGNWSKGNGWSEGLLLEHSIMPVQQFSYTTGKNATDMAMVIDAMDILYKNKIQGFCLVTSDSDFTRLAMRLREENLVAEQNKAAVADLDVIGGEEQNVTPISEVRQAILTVINENGGKQVDLARVGNRLNDKFSDFDARNYGYSKLSTMVAEEIPELRVFKKNNLYYVERCSSLTKEELEGEICRMIEKCGGTVDNLSTLNDELHKKYKQLDFKQFGFSRISSFLRSMKSVEVRENKVTLKRAEKGRK